MMKNLYSLLFLLLPLISFSQFSISFEGSEGYQLGTVNLQKNWEVTETSDGYLLNQSITDEQSSDGEYSFKNAFESDFSEQFFAIFGSGFEFESAINNSDFSISYDVYVNQANGSDFEFTAYGISEGISVPVVGVGFDYRGYIYALIDEEYGYDYLNTTWEPNNWYNIKIQVSGDQVNYYVNGELDKTLNKISNTDVRGINMLHNNVGGDAFYDNIKVNKDALGVNEMSFADFKIYPNPVNENTVVVVSGKDVSKIEIFDIKGEKVVEYNNVETLKFGNLSKGIYVVRVLSADGSSVSRKIIKE